MTTDDRQIRIDGARALLDFCEANPDIKLPFEITTSTGWTTFAYSPESFEAFVKAAVDPTVSREDKVLYATQMFGPITLRARVDLDEIEVPDRWAIKKMVEVPELDLNKVVLAAKAGA